MSNIFVDGFGTYGTGSGSDVRAAMVAAGWYEIDSLSGASITKLTGDTKDELWFYIGYQRHNRLQIPSSVVVRASFHFYADSISYGNNSFLYFSDSSATTIAELGYTVAGALEIGAGTSLVGIIKPQHDYHIEMELDVTSKTATVYVDGAEVITAASVTTTSTSAVFFSLAGVGITSADGVYISNLIIRDDQGSYNNTFPIGDRRVATLFPNSDVADKQGWTARPLQKLGAGVLYSDATNNLGVYAGSSDAQLGNKDFTTEGYFRFLSVPSGSEQNALFQKWGESGNDRSYQLVLNGPDLNGGGLVFRTSTDGTSATVTNKITVDWVPDLDTWYYLTVCRASGTLRLFIDGVQQGVDVTDTDIYYPAASGSSSLNLIGNLGSQSGVHGYQDEWRLTETVGRYSANFTPPTEPFPRDSTDPHWDNVTWLSGWDAGSISNDKPGGYTLSSSFSGVSVVQPDDGAHAFQTLNKATPNDHTFIEAALLSATGTLTLTNQPTANDTVTLGQYDNVGTPTTATYTFVTALASAFDVLIGATVTDSIANLVSAVNATTGEGTTYGTGTLVNISASATAIGASQMTARALTPGTGGNSIATSATGTVATWADTTLDGGEDIPAPSQFGFQRMPTDTTIVDSITLLARSWKLDSGTGKTQMSLVGSAGTVSKGAQNTLGTVVTTSRDTFEEDPETSGALTTTTALMMKAQIDRTE